MTSSGGSSIVPLFAELTTTNIRDDNIHQSITASLTEGIRYVAADEGYDNYELYQFSKYRVPCVPYRKKLQANKA